MSLWINDYHEKLRNLQNIPINVGVGINQEQLSTAQIQQLICWCRMVPTIRTLTIFHPYSHCDSIKLKTDESSDDDFQISFLTFESGRSSMIKAAKHFTNLKTNIMPTDDAIGEYLKQDYPCPDPQLLLIFGDCPIYNGFPSWQIRLSETVFLPPIEWTTISQFYQALKIFSTCEQRFGK